MSNGDPFETFRWKREIERMEAEFRENAAVRRRRLAQLSQGVDDTLEFERKVALEVRDFLSESATAAERVLGEIVEEGESADPAETEIRRKLEALIAGASPPTGEVDLSEQTGSVEQGGGTIRRRALARRYGGRAPDLRAALARIRRHAGVPPEEAEAPVPAGADGHSSRSQLLATFDETCCRVASLLEGGSREDSVQVVQPLPEEPVAGVAPEDELRCLRSEVRRLRKVVEVLVARGLLSEADLG